MPKDINEDQLIDVDNSLNSLFAEKEGSCLPKNGDPQVSDCYVV